MDGGVLFESKLSDPFFIPELLSFAVLGLVFGSFASALIHRIPLGKSAFGKSERSACAKCNHVLGVADLIPLLSWALSKGRCRYCGEKISALYPVVEMSAAFLAILVAVFYQADLLAEKIMVLFSVPFLLALSVIDLRHQILPNVLVLIVGVLGAARLGLLVGYGGDMPGMAVNFIGGGVIFGLFAWFVGFVMEKLLKKQALGMGDVKFFAVSGLWLGLGNLAPFCILTGALGVLLGLIWQKTHKEALFPFGPALIASFFIVLLLNSSHLL